MRISVQTHLLIPCDFCPEVGRLREVIMCPLAYFYIVTPINQDRSVDVLLRNVNSIGELSFDIGRSW
jgi:hypothetical protein